MPPNEHMADTVATKTILYFDHLYSLIHEFVKKKKKQLAFVRAN